MKTATKRTKGFYIIERHNPQLGVYYILVGQITKKEALEYEDTLYGSAIMLRFETKEEYNAKISELRNSGEKV